MLARDWLNTYYLEDTGLFRVSLVLGSKNEALAGDLLEEFKRRRSVAWYWRQVLGAIFVGFSNELRAQWLRVGFAIAWTCAVSASWKHIDLSPPFQSLLGWGVGHDWPESLIYVMAIYIAATVAIVWVGLSLYLAIMRCFNLRRFSRGLLVGLLVIVVADVGGIFLSGHIYRSWVVYIVWWLPLFLALLLSMWTARTSPKNGRATKIPAN